VIPVGAGSGENGAFFLFIAMAAANVKRRDDRGLFDLPAIAMALRRVFMVGTGLLLIPGEEAFAEETYSPNPFMNAGSLAALFAADILIRRSLGSRKIQATFAKDIVSRVFVAWHRSCSRLCTERAGHAHKRFHASQRRASQERPRGLTLIELVVVVGLIAVVLAISHGRDARRPANSFQLRRSATA